MLLGEGTANAELRIGTGYVCEEQEGGQRGWSRAGDRASLRPCVREAGRASLREESGFHGGQVGAMEGLEQECGVISFTSFISSLLGTECC